MGDKRVDNGGELAVHHFGELMHGQADAVVRNAVLWIVVGADFFGAVTGFDLAAALGGDGGLLLFQFHFIQPGTQHAHGLGAVFDLRFFVLLRNHQSRGQMRDAHGRISRVHGLPAGTRGAKRINAQVLGFNFDVDFIGFRKDGDRGGGGVDASLGFRGRNALHAVYAAFVFKFGVNLVALNGGHNFFHAAHGSGRAFHYFHFPALRFGVALIPTEEVAGEDTGFVAGGAGADFEDDVLPVVGVFGEE